MSYYNDNHTIRITTNKKSQINLIRDDSLEYTKDKPDIIFRGDNISKLTNDKGYITKADIPKQDESDPIYTKDKPNIIFKNGNISSLTNDKHYITIDEVPAQLPYTAGEGISISEDRIISLNLTDAEVTKY